MVFRSRHRRKPPATLMPPGERIYAIGDLHGRLDLLRVLTKRIEIDNATRAPAKVSIVVLGDFIDRGPDSALVMRTLMGWKGGRVVVLLGNHEKSLLDGIDGDRSAIDLWIEHGGDATLRSFGAQDSDIFPFDGRDLIPNVRRIIPRPTVAWLRKLPMTHRAGRYLFVHAGIRPDVAIHRQEEEDLLWIRDRFTASDADHGVVVVHGHTVTPEVCIRDNRIGVDTGAYRTGRLSAIGLEANEQWIVDTAIAGPQAMGQA